VGVELQQSTSVMVTAGQADGDGHAEGVEL
jgi:hypothetical protein